MCFRKDLVALHGRFRAMLLEFYGHEVIVLWILYTHGVYYIKHVLYCSYCWGVASIEESQGGASATLSAKPAGMSGEKATEAPVMTAAVAPVGVSAMKAAAAPGKKTSCRKRMPLVPSEAMSRIGLPPVRVPAVSEVRGQPFLSTNQ